jgi:hypothetical protein
MERALAWGFLLLFTVARAAETAPRPVITSVELASPAPARSIGAALTSGPDGTVWLSWVEPGRNGLNTLRYATLDTAARKWRTPRTIATGTDIAANAMDFPQVALDAHGGAVAMWTDGRGGALYSESPDGVQWNQRLPWTGESTQIEMCALAPLADGRVLAVWLDGRAVAKGGATRLYARIAGTTGPDVLVDESVCDCCPPALTAFPDGSALVAYRGRTADEVRDIRIARFGGRSWDEPRPLWSDDWRIKGCPVNGPRLASDGGRVAVTWFTAAGQDPRVLASFSSEAGRRFLSPLRMDGDKPAGQADTQLLRDGTMLVSWIGSNGDLWLRRINPAFSAGPAVRLAAAGRLQGSPRLVVTQQYAGSNSAAQLVAAYTPADANAGVRTILITVPEGDFLVAENDCGCAPTPEQLVGFGLRGTFTDALPSPGTLRVRHQELPGVLPAGTREFKVAPEVLAAAQPGRQFLGRVIRRDGEWWLFDVRLLATGRP